MQICRIFSSVQGAGVDWWLRLWALITVVVSLLALPAFARGEFRTSSLGDLNQLGASSSPNAMHEVGDDLYFSTAGPVGGSSQSLWRRDGITGQTTKLLDSYSFRGPAFGDFVQMGGHEYFLAGDDDEQNLYGTDGTAAGTQRIGDVGEASGLMRSGGRLFLSGTAGHLNFELWTSDGTDAGTRRVKDIYPGSESSSPFDLAATEDGVVFSARDGTGFTLWRSDGTADGTEPLTSRTGETLRSPSGMTGIGEPLARRVLLEAVTADSGSELWTTDGTPEGTEILTEHIPGPSGSAPRDITRIDSVVYYAASTPNGTGVFRTDGTRGGTELLTRAFSPHEFAVAGGWLYYREYDASTEMWRTKGGGTSEKVFDEDDFGDHYFVLELTAVGTDLYFVAREGGYSGNEDPELWKVGPGPAPPARVAEFRPGDESDAVGSLTAHNGSLFFRASDREHGAELWRTLPILGTPVLDADLDTDTLSSRPEQPVAVDESTFFFLAANGIDNQNLWVSDGTALGTQNVPFGEPEKVTDTDSLTAVDGDLYFTAKGSLWRVDGDNPLLAERLASWNGYKPADNLVEWRGKLYFRVTSDADEGLWTSDGTPAGTTQIAAIPQSDVGRENELAELVAASDALYMSGRDLARNTAVIWRSDGTAAGTKPAVDATEGLLNLTAGAQGVFYTGYANPDYGLWYSDGTPGGTLRLHGFSPGHFRNAPNQVTRVGDRVFFAADERPESDGGAGIEPWVSDGTVEGTRIVKNLTEGDSYPYVFEPVGRKAFFLADGGPLYRSDGTASGTIAIGGEHEDRNVATDVESIGERVLIRGSGATRQAVIYELRSNDPEARTTEIATTVPDRYILETTTIGQRLFLEVSDHIGAEPWIGTYDDDIDPPIDPPDTEIVQRPPNVNDGSDLHFSYRGIPVAAAASYQCRLNGASFEPCPSAGIDLGTVAEGEHRFEVRALDSDGHPDLTPAGWSFRVDSTAPESTFVPPVPTIVASTSATFRFSAEPGATFECHLDGEDLGQCSSPLTVSELTDGPHRLEVRAIDQVGNTEATPSVAEFSVDTEPPETMIDSGPPPRSSLRRATFTFSSTEDPAEFRCRLDAAAFMPCSSPHIVRLARDGLHRFEVHAIDAAGNREPETAFEEFETDTTGPLTSIARRPRKTATRRRSVAVWVRFSSLEPGATFQCRRDRGEFRSCSSPWRPRLRTGRHQLEVRAIDSLGNRGTAASISIAVIRKARQRGTAGAG